MASVERLGGCAPFTPNSDADGRSDGCEAAQLRDCAPIASKAAAWVDLKFKTQPTDNGLTVWDPVRYGSQLNRPDGDWRHHSAWIANYGSADGSR